MREPLKSFKDRNRIRLTGGSDGKEYACNLGFLGWIPGLENTSGEGNGDRLQYSCLENSMNRRAWWAMVHGIAESDTTDRLSLYIVKILL